MMFQLLNSSGETTTSLLRTCHQVQQYLTPPQNEDCYSPTALEQLSSAQALLCVAQHSDGELQLQPSHTTPPLTCCPFSAAPQRQPQLRPGSTIMGTSFINSTFFLPCISTLTNLVSKLTCWHQHLFSSSEKGNCKAGVFPDMLV